MANVVVPLLRFEESADSIQLDLATRGKNKKSISTIQSPLQFGSAYMVRCKNHINLHPDSESEKCCTNVTTQCALHCAKHQLDLNTSQKNTLILVFSYIYPTDENLRPPSPPEESWLNLLMFQEKYFSTVLNMLMYQEKYFRIVENLGDGLCLLYSISEFIRNHMDSSTPHTVTQYWNSMSNITNYETMIESKILEEMAMFLGDLSDDDFTWLVEYFTMEEYELKKNQKGPESHMTIPNINRLDHPFVNSLLLEIIDGTLESTRWPNECQAYVLSKMLQVRIVIIQDHIEVGFYVLFDTASSDFGGMELPQSSSFRKPPLVKKTCYLLRFDDGTPLGMCHWTQSRFKHFVYLDEKMDEISPEERMIAYKGRGGTQDLRWHPTNIDSWENLFEKDMLRNDSSAKEDICSPPDHSKPIVDANMVEQQDVREGGKREDDSGTGQKSISLSPAIAGSLPKSDQQANDQNDPSELIHP